MTRIIRVTGWVFLGLIAGLVYGTIAGVAITFVLRAVGFRA